MALYIVKNHATNETQKVYSGNSMEAKRSVCSCMGWISMECSVRMVSDR